MDALEIIRRQIAGARRLTDAVMQDTTEAQFNWLPPGMANSMKAALLHALASEDRYIQVLIQGKPRLWETGGWSAKIGLAVPPGRDGGWEEIKAATVTIAPVLAYAAAVRAATDAYVATLTAGELERAVQWMDQTRQVADLLVMQANHIASHAGEMAAIKGMQGVKGLPF
jgi:uncharacterized damage-inducible protein DinB